MGDADEPERIEIELVSDDPASPFAPPGPGAGTTGSTRPDRDERRTLIIAGIVGVVAVALGWMLGRAGAETASPARTSEVSTTDRRESVVPIASAVPEETPAPRLPVVSSAAPADPTGSESSDGDGTGVVVEQIEVAEAFAGRPIEIIVFRSGNLLQRLDLTSGEMVTREVDRQPFGRPRIVVGNDWVMLPTADPAFETVVVNDDGRVRSIDPNPFWFVLGSSDGETVWLSEPRRSDRGPRFIDRVSELGTLVERVEVPGRPDRFDPRGGFVVETAGGVFSVDGEAVERITPGHLIALGRDAAVAEECDERSSCSFVAVARETGERRVIVSDEPGSLLPRLVAIGSESISPNGDIAIVWVVEPTDDTSGQPTLGLLDLMRGSVIEIGPAQGIDESVWTPDGRFVLYVRGGNLVGYEVATGEEQIVADELIAINAFATRSLGE